jgi:hypothetical protein
MNFFKDAAEHMGAVDHKLIREGILARGDVIKVERTAFETGDKNMPDLAAVCKVTVTVTGLPDHAPYEAHFLAPIHPSDIPDLEKPGAAVAVRVDAKDLQNIALDVDSVTPSE